MDSLKENLSSSIPFVELDVHMNDPEFIDAVVEAFISMMGKQKDDQ